MAPRGRTLDYGGVPIAPGFLLRERYDVVEELGRGGHAVVYRAHDRVLERDVAIKVLREDVLAPDIRARFTQEIQLMARLEHAHILRVHDSGTEGEQPFVVMELAPSQTLAHRMAREPQLPVADALQITREVGSALAHAHAQGILHRDVKPENILIGQGGALLADFGIARITGELTISRITSTGEAVGTLQYMSPEQLCAEHVDARSDQYALACVLYEMLAGVKPHAAATFEGLRALRLTGRHSPVSVYRASISPALAGALERAMSVAPADRFRTMEEFLMALELVVTGDALALRGAPASPEKTGHAETGAAHADVVPTRARTRHWPRVIAATLAIGALAAVVWPSPNATSAETVSLVDAATPTANEDALSQALAARVRSELATWSDARVSAGVRRRERPELVVTLVGDSALVRFRGHSALLLRTTRDALARSTDVPHHLAREALAHVSDAPALALPGVRELTARSGTALWSFVEGHRQLSRGQVDSAANAFAVAADDAPEFAAAHFWRAQLAAWGSRPVTSWRPLADQALRYAAPSVEDSLLRAGLQHLAHGRHLAACAAYDTVLTRAPQDFAAWFGRGECERRDSLVIVTAGTPAFRSSHWSALRAYREGLAHVPSAGIASLLLPVVSRLTYSAGSEMRAGRSADGRAYFALPSRLGDSVAFVPVDSMRFVTGGAGALPATWNQALRVGRAVAAEITSRLTERFASDGRLWLAHAIALERVGAIDPADPVSAYGALNTAESHGIRAIAAMDADLLRIRLTLRRGLLDSAATLARGMLTAGDSATIEPWRRTARRRALATLANDSTRLASLPAPGEDTLPGSMRAPWRAYRAALLLDDCEAARARADHLQRAAFTAFADAERVVRSRFLADAYRLGTECLGVKRVGAASPSGTPLDAVIVALARGDRAQARRALAANERNRAGATRSSLTWNYVALEAWLRREAGDTSGAEALVRDAFDDLPAMSAYTLEDAEHVAGLRRALQQLATDRRRGGRGDTIALAR